MKRYSTYEHRYDFNFLYVNKFLKKITNIIDNVPLRFIQQMKGITYSEFWKYSEMLLPSSILQETDVIKNKHGLWVLPKEKKQTFLFYIHGGGYSMWSPYSYIGFMRALCHRLDVAIYAPFYTRGENIQDMQEILLTSYRQSVSFNGLPIAIAGDSAGGGLVISLLEQLDVEERPSKIVLISPWLDTFFSEDNINNSNDYIPMKLLRQFSDDLQQSNTDWLTNLNNIFDKKDVLPDTMVLIGDDEIFKQGIIKKLEQYKWANPRWNVEISVTSGMSHSFPVIGFANHGEPYMAMSKMADFLHSDGTTFNVNIISILTEKPYNKISCSVNIGEMTGNSYSFAEKQNKNNFLWNGRCITEWHLARLDNKIKIWFEVNADNEYHRKHVSINHISNGENTIQLTCGKMTYHFQIRDHYRVIAHNYDVS